MSYSDLQIKKIFTFNTKAPALLGATLKNATLLAIVDYDTAMTYDNVDLKFRQIYPLLPSGTPDDPRSFTYYYFRSESGEKVIFAEPWIDEVSIEVITFIDIRAILPGRSLSDIQTLRNALNALGWTGYTIEEI